jgi:signal transduction histidine kinase
MPAPSTEAAFDSLGRLAGELAHDVNNQLAAALNYVFILRRRLAAIEPIASHLEELQAAVWRASGLASTLRVVGRTRNADPEALLLEDVVHGLQPLLRHIARDVRVEAVHAADAYALNAPRAYVEQAIVIVALVLLARAPTDSVLRVSTIRAQRPGRAPSARLVLELVGDREPAPARSNSNGHSTHHGLRRALKRCGARMGHDARSVWIEF